MRGCRADRIGVVVATAQPAAVCEPTIGAPHPRRPSSTKVSARPDINAEIPRPGRSALWSEPITVLDAAEVGTPSDHHIASVWIGVAGSTCGSTVAAT
jgi:hypothetical protein